MKTLEIYFEFAKLKTNWRQESIAGLTTFLTMAYIIFVNPSILADAGMNPAAVTRHRRHMHLRRPGQHPDGSRRPLPHRHGPRHGP